MKNGVIRLVVAAELNSIDTLACFMGQGGYKAMTRRVSQGAGLAARVTVDLTPFHGHRIVMKLGVQDESQPQPQTAVSARISPANGRTGCRPSEMAKEFGCHETSILTWVKRAQAATSLLSDQPAFIYGNINSSHRSLSFFG